MILSGLTFRSLIHFAFIGGGIISLVAAALSPYFLEIIKVPVEIRADAQKYLWIYFSGLAVFMVYYRVGFRVKFEGAV